jgi:hypothetical protein
MQKKKRLGKMSDRGGLLQAGRVVEVMNEALPIYCGHSRPARRGICTRECEYFGTRKREPWGAKFKL